MSSGLDADTGSRTDRPTFRMRRSFLLFIECLLIGDNSNEQF
jgi:hypothetical protein